MLAENVWPIKMHTQINWTYSSSPIGRVWSCSETQNKRFLITNQANKIICSPQTSLSEEHNCSVKSSLITEDPPQPLHHSLQLRPSGRRFKIPLVWKALYKKSFILFAIPTLKTLKNKLYFAFNSPALCVSMCLYVRLVLLYCKWKNADDCWSSVEEKNCHRLGEWWHRC